jgi:DNA-binding NarL/FixJ family response regulator
MWRILIVEDDAQMRDFFASSIQRCEQLRLSGVAGTVAEAVAWLDEPANEVDLMVVDLGLPDGSGQDVIRHAAQLRPSCESLVISMFGDEENVLASIEAGALGYIHKDSTPDDIAQTLLHMKAGASPISPMIARRVLSKYATLRSAPPPAPARPAERREGELPALSPKEQEVLELVARGFSYLEISRLQQISVHTVQSHVKSLYRKLSVHSRGEAVYEAMCMGLIRR